MSKQLKQLPEEVADELSTVERIQAHYDDQYALSEEDGIYLDKLNMVFKCIHQEENRDISRAKLKMLLGEGDHQKIIDDTVAVYGDFFDINKKVMRVIQEKRYQRLYESAMRANEYAPAGRALNSIDRLQSLYTESGDDIQLPKNLPRIKRTSNPEALASLINDND